MGKRKREGEKKSLKVEKIPVPKGSDHLPPPLGEGLLPIHEFTMSLIAPKGSGKTTTIINLLAMYAGYFHEIYIFSPSIKSDVKWKYAKQLEVLCENKRLKDFMLRYDDDQNGPVQDIPLRKKLEPYVDLSKKFDPKIPEECFFEVYDEAAFKKIMDGNRAVVDILDDYGQLKTMANRILIIFDDQVGSKLFSGKRGDYFVGVNTRHRHYSASMIMVSQGYKEIPKTIRTNFTCLLLFKIGNMRELFVIYEEFQMGLTWDEWLKLYQHATAEDFDFLFIDMYGPKNMRMRKNLDTALVYMNQPEEEG